MTESKDRGGSAASEPARARTGWRKKVMLALLVGAVVVGGGYFGHQWWTVDRFVEDTDDAYVKADIVNLSAEVSGTVTTVSVEDNQYVEKGAVLVRLDDRDYRAALRSAEARIDVARAAIETIAANRNLQARRIEAGEADLATASANLEFARKDLDRKKALVAKGATTARSLDEARNAYRTATATRDKARATLEGDRNELAVLAAQRKQRLGELESARADRTAAETNLDRTVIRAPRAGTVGNREIEAGETVASGTRLLSIVPRDDFYVVANFKETQIEHFREGMDADIALDMFGGRHFRGHIASLAPATGSEFALLPPQNATGNFTKIVQRVPVRLRFDEAFPNGLSPRPGSSAIVIIRTDGDAS
ncbi:HlyD family secretion protein [Marivibrio halodurans]|uniref:HlyD family secretion protein n=1 Tax=Marivibrio halodurans TaxID=2039722 RepID=A0A8J7RZ99_9PROT|nr:HlyD family secretion protein [Marivibrio halodurans]MBP5855809.1 HlyD family secretion protein [Marivibrio halodurans]